MNRPAPKFRFSLLGNNNGAVSIYDAYGFKGETFDTFEITGFEYGAYILGKLTPHYLIVSQKALSPGNFIVPPTTISFLSMTRTGPNHPSGSVHPWKHRLSHRRRPFLPRPGTRSDGRDSRTINRGRHVPNAQPGEARPSPVSRDDGAGLLCVTLGSSSVPPSPPATS